MRVMQVAVDEVVDVVTVRNGLMAAARTVDVVAAVAGARMLRCADSRIGAANLERALVHMSLVEAVQVTVVQIVDVIAVAHGAVTAVGAVLVGVVVVDAMSRHESSDRLRAAAGLRRVVDGSTHDGDDMVVGQGVSDVAAVPCPRHQMLGTQHPDPLGDGRQALTFGLRKIGDAGRPLGQARQQAETCFVSQGPEQPGGALERLRRPVDGRKVLTLVRRVAPFGGGLGSGLAWHEPIMRSLKQSCKC